MEDVTIIVGNDVFMTPFDILNKSNILKALLQEDNTIIMKDENPDLMRHLLLKLRHEDYVYPKKLQEQMKQFEEKYKLKEFVVPLFGNYVINLSHKPNTEISKKAQLYIDEAKGDIDEAFRLAMSEDFRTLRSIYNQGVDLNYDVGKPNGLNMFNWSITAHGVCSTSFLEYMFKFERRDLEEYQQKVFEMACGYATPKHIDVFIKYVGLDKLDLFYGIWNAILNNNLINLHYLMLYYEPEKLKENAVKLMKLVDNPSICMYLVTKCHLPVTQEILLESLSRRFYETFKYILLSYLELGGKSFELTSDMIKEAMCTTDRLDKLQLLVDHGFTGINIDELKKLEKDGLLKEPSIRRYYTRGY